ncbi:MAG: hypothetical protein LBC47_01280, partial [Tannerella sp.]|nr:hypothetical protein [Tannerella sp.]
FQNKATKVLNLSVYKGNSIKSFGLFCVIGNYIYLCAVKLNDMIRNTSHNGLLISIISILLLLWRNGM